MNLDTKKLVWAKQRCSPYWPACVIDEPPPEIGGGPKGSKCVLFFGTKNYAWIEPNSMEEYLPNREKFLKKYKRPGILKAAAEMDKCIADPVQHKIPNTAETDGLIQVKLEPEGDAEEPTIACFSIGSKEPKKRKNLVSELELKKAKQQLETISSEKKHLAKIDSHQITETPSVIMEMGTLKMKLESLNEHIVSVQSTVSSLTNKMEIESQLSTSNTEIESLKNELQEKKEMLAKQEQSSKSMEADICSKELEIAALQGQNANMTESQTQPSVEQQNEASTLKHEIDDLKIKLAAANTKIQTHSSALDELKQEGLKSVELVKQEFNEQITSYKNELSVSKTEIESLKKELKQEKEIVVKQEQSSKSKEADILSKELEIAALKSQNAKMAASQNQLSVEHKNQTSAFTREIDDLKIKLAAANTKIQTHSSALDELKQEGLKSVELVKHGFNEQITSYKNELSVSKTEIESLKKELKQEKEIVVKQEQSSKAMQADIRSKELEITSLQERLKSFESEKQSLSADLLSERNENKSLQARIVELNTELGTVQNNFEVQTELVQSTQRELHNLRKEKQFKRTIVTSSIHFMQRSK